MTGTALILGRNISRATPANARLGSAFTPAVPACRARLPSAAALPPKHFCSQQGLLGTWPCCTKGKEHVPFIWRAADSAHEFVPTLFVPTLRSDLRHLQHNTAWLADTPGTFPLHIFRNITIEQNRTKTICSIIMKRRTSLVNNSFAFSFQTMHKLFHNLEANKFMQEN